MKIPTDSSAGRPGTLRRRIAVAAGLTIAIAAAGLGLLIAQTDQAESSPPTIMLVLQPWGFAPSEVIVRPGPVQFHVYNRVGFEELALQLDREISPGPSRQAVLRERAHREEKKWDRSVALTPGTYVLSEETHPDWTCRIVVQ